MTNMEYPGEDFILAMAKEHGVDVSRLSTINSFSEALWRLAHQQVDPPVREGWRLVPLDATMEMTDALWSALPTGFSFKNCTPKGVIASILLAAPPFKPSV
jgi:hypothetical protein